MSFEGLVGTVLALIVVILDQAGVKNPLILWLAFVLALFLCVDSVRRTDKEKRFKAGMYAVIFVCFGAFGVYLYTRGHEHTNASATPAPTPVTSSSLPLSPTPTLTPTPTPTPTTTPQSRHAVWACSAANYPPMSNTRAKECTLEFVGKVRCVVEDYEVQSRKAEDDMMAALQSRSSNDEVPKIRQKYLSESNAVTWQAMHKYETTFKVDALLIRDALISKLPAGTRNDEADLIYRSPTNPIGIRKIADDLERLAKLLPEDAPKKTPPPTASQEPDIRFVQERIASTSKESPIAYRVTIQTARTVSPVRILVTCDKTLTDGMQVNSQVFVMYAAGVVPERPNTFVLKYESPPFTPSEPIILHLFAKTDFHVQKIEVF